MNTGAPELEERDGPRFAATTDRDRKSVELHGGGHRIRVDGYVYPRGEVIVGPFRWP
jgi:hypothetical protein